MYPPTRGSERDGGPQAASPPRVYKAWKGNNIFFLEGRFIFGPDVRSLFFTMFLIVAPVIVFCVFVARKLMDHFSHHLGIVVMVVSVVFTLCDIVLLLMTAGSDPGIIPRSAYPPEPEGDDGNVGRWRSQYPLRIPQTMDVIVNGMTVKIKYCDTCMLFRPPRSSHCSICNNCVQRFDHHCPWIGQCVGLRNYRLFYMFVISTALLCIYVFTFCWIYLKERMDADDSTIWKAMTKAPASIPLIIYTFVAFWFVGGLSIFHLYLMSTNQTTYENFKYRYEGPPNPFNKGVLANLKEFFFTRIPPSLDFRARVQREEWLEGQARPARGFMSPHMGKGAEDIESGRKAFAWEGEVGGMGMGDDLEAGTSNEMLEDDDVLAEGEGLGTANPKHSILGRTQSNIHITERLGTSAGVGGSEHTDSSDDGGTSDDGIQ